MHRKLLVFLALLLTTFAPVSAQNVPNYTNAIKTFGDYTNSNPAPTSGTLTGLYTTRADWIQTGSITCNACRLKFGGTATFNNVVTISAGMEGNAAPTDKTLVSSTSGGGGWAAGSGPGAGYGAVLNPSGNSVWPSGGGHGGAGGAGAFGAPFGVGLPGGQTYPNELFLAGSSGGAPESGGTSGAGGGGFYVEAIGNVNFTSGAALTANGGNAATNGAGGAGGGIDIRSLHNITVNSGATITANGGTGIFGGGGGGGKVVLMPGPTGTLTQSGTISVSGGSASSGGGAGSTGTTSAPATFVGPRMGF